MTIIQIIENGLQKKFNIGALPDGTNYRYMDYCTTNIKIFDDKIAIDNTFTRATIELRRINELYFIDTTIDKVLRINTQYCDISITL